MEYNKLKKEVEATVKKQADDYFEDMLRHPQEYDYLNVNDEDECWEEAIEKAKEDMRLYPKDCLDEDFQEEMTESDFDKIWDIADGIAWQTYNNLEIEKAFA